jgi:signal transduction histidine kinase
MSAQIPHICNLHSSPANATVLVVDDESSIRDLCEQALRKYNVIKASTCDEAMRVYKSEHIDLILSDISMPGGSGIDLLKQVKAYDPNATVVIMTGFVDKDVILNALKEDADDFINKPLNLIQLKTSIEKALTRKTLKEELANLKHSDELKTAFMSLVSHKLRTPITGISLFLQNLQDGIFSSDDPAFRQHIAMANEEAGYLGRLVTDLLAFSQVMVNGAGVKKETCNLNELITATLLKCRELYSHGGVAVDFTPTDLPLLQLDVPKIGFALYQVLDNAHKFSGDFGQISIKVNVCGDSVLVVISDTGIGIPDLEIPKIFEKFYQVDQQRTGQIRGFGLGLFYARDFIRQHGGSISLVSEPGLGTTVTIAMPLQ